MIDDIQSLYNMPPPLEATTSIETCNSAALQISPLFVKLLVTFELYSLQHYAAEQLSYLCDCLAPSVSLRL